MAAATSALAGATFTNTKSEASRTQLSKNMDMFLKMLTTQLKHQDPTSPMDSTNFTNQLVQFANVEQQIQVNSNLETMIEMEKQTHSSQAVSYIGQTIQAKSSLLPLESGRAEYAYTTPEGAKKVMITISDTAGNIVYSATGDQSIGTHTATWDGRDDDGVPLPDGLYKIKVTSEDADKEKTDLETVVTGTVTSVYAVDGETQLSMAGALIKTDDIITIKKGIRDQLADAIAYVGKTVKALGNSIVKGDSGGTVTYEVPSNTMQVKISIVDSAGKEIYAKTEPGLAGMKTFNWDGKDKLGNPMANGAYTIKIQAVDARNISSAIKPEMSGFVESVSATSGRVYLSIGGAQVPVEDVKQVM